MVDRAVLLVLVLSCGFSSDDVMVSLCSWQSFTSLLKVVLLFPRVRVTRWALLARLAVL